MTNFEDIEKNVVEWSLETFPNATEEVLADKFDEEVEELFGATCVYPVQYFNRHEEIADVCIVAMRELHEAGTSLAEVIGRKLEINRQREWGPEEPNGDRVRVR